MQGICIERLWGEVENQPATAGCGVALEAVFVGVVASTIHNELSAVNLHADALIDPGAVHEPVAFLVESEVLDREGLAGGVALPVGIPGALARALRQSA